MDKYILIADDNEGILDILKTYAEKEGFMPLLAHDGLEAIDIFSKYHPLLLLLDVMMPKKDGFEVCREIRQKSNVPIIMITAKGEDSDRIMGLDIGADDYIVKPFSPGEVMARIRAILRRVDNSNEDNKKVTQHPGLEINIAEYEVKVNGSPVNLTKKEIEILWLLATNPGKVFSRDNLLDSVWGYEYFGDARTVDTHIKRLRAKIDISDKISWDIKTIWGVGYKFEVKHV
ncbi:two component transcriptional regulator, winged helix family [Ruminiclostridium papyrosolvens DSM 2782]|uniref:Stage 0 sporulation protein A homolog n=1 Tax=Ruminiclostridium papyrosolvens DSM 2782 TaxID=588581 RepID=F1TDE3_9FIRM|nr:response regulator transcription factor [Ruminiclostridium papyrosolvens]EGD47581.1 two component transcriptional regulator, winged helix family [Ruminiclostridium papyrosolvens DSM 2782]WES36614.1 response regulator transcription factor [Ruminiclostridium papyrosolvens DSM 2782]